MSIEDDPRVSGEYEKPAFKLAKVSDLIANPKPVPWLIKRLVEETGVHLMFGAYGTGKSFCAFDMAFCVANGIEWLGRKVQTRPVVILCGEGHSAIGHRFDALARHYGIKCPENIYVSEIPARFTDAEFTSFVLHSLDTVAKNAFVIVDTLNRNFGAGDENSTKDMTAFIGNIDRFMRGSGKTVMIIHHSGHTDKDRGRGNSSLPSSCEGEFKITATDGGLVCEVIRLKNTENKKEKFEFKFKKIPLGIYDDEGEEVSSLVIEYVGEYDKPREIILTRREEDIYQAFFDALETDGVPPNKEIRDKFAGFTMGNTLTKKRVARLEIWRKMAYKTILDVHGDEEQGDKHKKNMEIKKKTFARAVEKLKTLNKIMVYDGYVWLL